MLGFPHIVKYFGMMSKFWFMPYTQRATWIIVVNIKLNVLVSIFQDSILAVLHINSDTAA